MDKQPGPGQRCHHTAKASFFSALRDLSKGPCWHRWNELSRAAPSCLSGRDAGWMSLGPYLREVAELGGFGNHPLPSHTSELPVS